MLFVLHKIFFYHTTYFQKLWAIYFVSDLEKNISFIIHGNWVGLTELFKVFVLLILLWIFGLFFPYLLTSKRMAVFLGFTIVYLSLLDIFTSYDEGEPMFWSIFIGLLFIGVLRVYHTRKRIG
ncbi:hypothetical protein [Scopulibacillus daqui]|nr:hypothetical protein [Scopulibacillus daqui]